jgi:site-specific recombinase XerD
MSMPRTRPGDCVFLNNEGKPYKASGLRSIMRRHSGGKTPYQLRHTFAQNASEEGVAMDVLAKLLGHNRTLSTQFYYEVRDSRAVEAVKTLKPRLAVRDVG